MGALATADLSPLARRIADRASVSDIELHATPLMLHGVTWYDTRPMLDPREHCDDALQMAAEAIEYAVARRLVTRHDEQPHLVRVAHELLWEMDR